MQGTDRRAGVRRAQRRSRGAAFSLERLEGRMVLSTVVWNSATAPAGGAWSMPSNWIGGVVPGPGDDVTIDLASPGTITLATNAALNSLSTDADATFSLTSGILALAADSTLSGAFRQSGGTLTGTGVVTVSGPTTWTNGTQSGGGSTVALGGMALGAGTRLTLDQRTLVNSGAATLASGTTGEVLTLTAGARVENLAGATFTFITAASVNAPAGPGGVPTTAAFLNQGTLAASVPVGSSAVFGIPIASTGVVRADAGILSFRNGGTFGGAGSLEAAAGAKLEFYGAYSSEAGTTISGSGSVDSRSGTFVHAGSYAVAGATTVAGGVLQLSGPVAAAGLVTISTGTLNLGASAVTIPALVQSGGTLIGTGVLTVSGATNWSGGTQSGSGSTVAVGGLTLGLATSGTSQILTGRTLVNLGAATLATSSQNSGLTLASGGSLVNEAGATFAFLSDARIQEGGGSGGVVNRGTLSKAGGTASSSFITAPLSGDGAVRADVGRFDLMGGGSFTGSAALSAAAGATLWFRAGTFAAGAGTTISGAGAVEFSATSFVHSGTYDVSGTTRASGGSTNLEGPITSPGSSVTVTAGIGTMRLSGPVVATGWGLTIASGTFRADVDLTVGSIAQSGGVLTGGSKVTVTGPIGWSGGSQAGTGSTLALGGMTISAAGSPLPGLSQRTLDNAGVASMVGPGASLRINSGGRFVNQAGAEFRFDGGGAVGVSGSGYFLNHGTVAKVGEPGTATLFADVQNDGLISSLSGTLRVGELTLLGSGSVEAAAGTTLELTRVVGGAGSRIAGAGTFRFMDGNNEFGGAYDVTGATESVAGATQLTGSIINLGMLRVSGGDLNISSPTTTNVDIPSLLLTGGRLRGSTSLHVLDELTWTAGTLAVAGSGSVTSTGMMTIGSADSTAVQTLAGVLYNRGEATLSNAGSGGLVISVRFQNATEGIFRILTDARISNVGGQGIFANDGVLAKVGGAGSSAITARLENSGQVRVDVGVLSLGNLASLNPTSRRLERGTYVVAGELVVAGDGIVGIDAPASITLVGPGAGVTDSGGLDALRNLADIGPGGSLILTGGATASISGSLLNRGSLTIGPASVLSIAMNYVQRATGVFTAELAGAEIGRLDVVGAATLDGAFRARAVGEVLVGGTREALRSAGRVGAFSSFTAEAPAWADLGYAYVPGAVVVTADVEPVLVSIAVAPTSASLAAGLSTQFTATGTYSDGSTADLTATAEWTSSVFAVAEVSNSPGSHGLAIGYVEGQTSINATLAGVSGTAVLTVTPAELIQLMLSPASTSVVVGQERTFTATGRYTDGTYRDLSSTASWASLNPSIATVDSTGTAAGVGVGTTTILASIGGFSASAPLAVQTTARASSIAWGTAGSAGLTSPDGVRLLPVGRSRTIGWIGVDRITIELDHAAALASGDVSVIGLAGGDYGPVTVVGSGTSYVIILGRPITQADRVTLTISSQLVAGYTRRLDFLPGDVNDDGFVTIQDAILVRNRYANIGPITLPIEWFDVLGEGQATRNGYNAVSSRIGSLLP